MFWLIVLFTIRFQVRDRARPWVDKMHDATSAGQNIRFLPEPLWLWSGMVFGVGIPYYVYR